VFEDADDLAALIEKLGLAPAQVAGNSFGAAIVSRAATRHPEVFQRLIAHEPPVFALLAGTELEPALQEVQRRAGAVIGLLERGDHQSAARLFVDTIAFGADAWETQLTPEVREVFIANAPTFLDETPDPDSPRMDLDALAGRRAGDLHSASSRASRRYRRTGRSPTRPTRPRPLLPRLGLTLPAMGAVAFIIATASALATQAHRQRTSDSGTEHARAPTDCIAGAVRQSCMGEQSECRPRGHD
jgi:pimeloyl-ACP methyl ester carboxylesterase